MYVQCNTSLDTSPFPHHLTNIMQAGGHYYHLMIYYNITIFTNLYIERTAHSYHNGFLMEDERPGVIHEVLCYARKYHSSMLELLTSSIKYKKTVREHLVFCSQLLPMGNLLQKQYGFTQPRNQHLYRLSQRR